MKSESNMFLLLHALTALLLQSVYSELTLCAVCTKLHYLHCYYLNQTVDTLPKHKHKADLGLLFQMYEWNQAVTLYKSSILVWDLLNMLLLLSMAVLYLYRCVFMFVRALWIVSG